MNSFNSLKEIIAYYNGSRDCDAWGSCMSARFDVAAILYNRGDDIPEAWNFSPGGMGGPQEVNDSEYLFYDSSVLVDFGNILEKLSSKLEENGLAY